MALAAVVAALVLPGAASRTRRCSGRRPRTAPCSRRRRKPSPSTSTTAMRVAPGNAAVENATKASVLAGRRPSTGASSRCRCSRSATARTACAGASSRTTGTARRVCSRSRSAPGSTAPHSVLGASAPLTWSDILLRTLYYFGLLAGGGRGRSSDPDPPHARPGAAQAARAAALLLAAPRVPRRQRHRPFRPAGDAIRTRREDRAGRSARRRRGRRARPDRSAAAAGSRCAAALALLAAPTLSGHALDRGQPRVLAALADLAHLAAAAVWLGGLLALVYVVPRATGRRADATSGSCAAFSTVALVAVLVLGATRHRPRADRTVRGLQLWSTSYGRALLGEDRPLRAAPRCSAG